MKERSSEQQAGKTCGQRGTITLITHHPSLITGAALLLLLAGCSTPRVLQGGATASYFDDNLRYEHPFTEAALESARKDAERECTSRKQVAIKAHGTCTLERCVTNYVCVKPADVAAPK